MKVMFPMIADLSEYLTAKQAVDKEKAYLAALGHAKAMIRSLDQAKHWRFMEPLLQSPTHSLRGDLLEFAGRNGVVF